MTPDVRTEIADLFARQHAVAGRAQLLDCGIDAAEYALQVQRGIWVELCRGVVLLRGSPSVWHQRPMAATLASPHVAVARGTALRLHGLDGYRDTDSLELIAPRGTKPVMPDGASLVTTRRLGPLDIVTVDGIRTTNIATSLFHVARSGASDQVAKAVDHALRRGSSPGWLAATGRRWRGGINGAHVLQQMLDERVGKRLPRSWFERLAQRALAERGVVLEHEYPLRVGRRVLARFDLADPASRSGVECQSWEWHATPAAQQRDLDRKRMVRQQGWDFSEVWWTDLDRMDAVAADVLLTIERQRIIHGLPALAV